MQCGTRFTLEQWQAIDERIGAGAYLSHLYHELVAAGTMPYASLKSFINGVQHARWMGYVKNEPPGKGRPRVRHLRKVL